MSNSVVFVISGMVGYHHVMNAEQTLSRAERNRLQLRADIVEAAYIEFSERGYHQTAIADIAQRLGIGHGTFYRHFENKRDILDHVIGETLRKLTELLTGENAPSAVVTLAEYREQCRRIGRRFNEFARANPGALRLVLLEATSIDEAMTQRIFALVKMMGQLVADYMRNGVQRGFFRADLDCEETGQAIIGMIMGGMMRFLADPTDTDGFDRYAEAIVSLLVAGMAAPGASLD